MEKWSVTTVIKIDATASGARSLSRRSFLGGGGEGSVREGSEEREVKVVDGTQVVRGVCAEDGGEGGEGRKVVAQWQVLELYGLVRGCLLQLLHHWPVEHLGVQGLSVLVVVQIVQVVALQVLNIGHVVGGGGVGDGVNVVGGGVVSDGVDVGGGVGNVVHVGVVTGGNRSYCVDLVVAVDLVVVDVSSCVGVRDVVVVVVEVHKSLFFFFDHVIVVADVVDVDVVWTVVVVVA